MTEAKPVGRNCGIDEEASNAFEEAIASHTVGIVVAGGTEVGSGIAATWGGLALVITAKHVVNDIDLEEIRFFGRPSGSLVRATKNEIESAKPMVVTTRRKLDIAEVRLNESHDLALLEVDLKQIERDLDIRPYQIGQPSNGILQGTVVFGLQAELSRKIVPGCFAVCPAVEWTDEAMGETADCFFVNYRSAPERHPRGFSGGGVWAHQALKDTEKRIWHANPFLLGMATHYLPQSQRLQILKIARILQFVQAIYGPC